MTRPRVPDDKRKRISQACETCRGRKQKCTGEIPCAICEKKSLTCFYSSNSFDRGSDKSSESPPKRRMLEAFTSPTGASAPGDAASHVSPEKDESVTNWQRRSSVIGTTASDLSAFAEDTVSGFGHDSQRDARDQTLPGSMSIPPTDDDHETQSRVSTTSGPVEWGKDMYSTTRMLRDETGRLLYFGDSATLAYLHFFRLLIKEFKRLSGDSDFASDFTDDPRKESIVEKVYTLPQHIRIPCPSPNRRDVNILVESFFTNTSGLFEVFDKQEFDKKLEKYYDDAPAMAVEDPHFLCHLYLTFAIGLVLATPSPGTLEYTGIERLSRRAFGQDSGFDQAEIFFRSGRYYGDPSSGFEDAGLWSVQALLLMSIYMLSVSKRNAAYAQLGMAVRSAFALGLHKEETFVLALDHNKLKLRCNLVRSIFILDRFLAVSLGRPAAMSEKDCSEVALHLPAETPGGDSAASDAYHSRGIDAAVHSSRTIGIILRKMYSRGKVSTQVAQKIVDKCSSWHDQLLPDLQARRAQLGIDPRSPGYGVAILHVNLLHCHSVILLTRPFFVVLVQSIHPGATDRCKKAAQNPEMRRYGEICVSASCHTIQMIQNALEGRYLSRRNPFIMYFLFSAALIVLSNEYALLYPNSRWEDLAFKATDLLDISAKVDPQAERLHRIIEMFDAEVKRRTASRSSSYRFPQSRLISQQNSDPGFDPIPYFFTSTPAGDAAKPSHQSQTPAVTRHGSMPSLLSLLGPTSLPGPSQALAPFLASTFEDARVIQRPPAVTAPLPPLRSSTRQFGVSAEGHACRDYNQLSAVEPEPLTFNLDWSIGQPDSFIGFAPPPDSTNGSREPTLEAMAPLYENPEIG